MFLMDSDGFFSCALSYLEISLGKLLHQVLHTRNPKANLCSLTVVE